MISENLLSPMVPTLQPTDSGSSALRLMEETNLAQLPIVVDNKYHALVKESDLLDWDTPEKLLTDSGLLDYRPAVFFGGHPLEALRIVHQNHLEVLPVIGEESQYLGAITRDTLFRYVGDNSGLEAPGGILVLELEPRNYALTQIARICENEDVLITSMQLSGANADGKMQLTLKTNKTRLDAVVSSFERYGYEVKEVYGAASEHEEVMDRYAMLMNYINM